MDERDLYLTIGDIRELAERLRLDDDTIVYLEQRRDEPDPETDLTVYETQAVAVKAEVFSDGRGRVIVCIDG